jgi:precorrin-6B methylase 2
LKYSKENIKPDRPDPIFPDEDLIRITKKSALEPVIQSLIDEKYVLIEDHYHTGMAVLAELKNRIFGNKAKSDFKAYRGKRSEFHEASNRLLVPVRVNKIALDKSPDIGWLKELYPDITDFMLSFPQIQGLNSSWQWYLKGISYPGLKKRIHPYYGTYFPTRFEHLRLFYNWLKRYSGPKVSAIDIGTGCGVLSFQLLTQGFEKVIAADINSNALISVSKSAEEFGFKDRLDIVQSDLFEHIDHKGDLIVFNPPWLPAQSDLTGLDHAIYYETGFFERFFEQAGNYLNADGRLVLLFSNIGKAEHVTQDHPVKTELSNYHRFRKIELLEKKAAKASRKTKRRSHRRDEIIELWVLEKIFSTD